MTQKPAHRLFEHRMASGFSQEEMAFLLGASSGSRVSRYEAYRRLPHVDMMMAYLVIHQRPLKQLFDGKYLQVARGVLERARALENRLSGQPREARKVELIRAMILVIERGLQELHE